MGSVQYEKSKARTIFPALYERNRYFQPFLITLWLYCILTARDISCNTYQYLSVRMWLGFWKWKYKCFYCFYYSIYFFFFRCIAWQSEQVKIQFRSTFAMYFLNNFRRLFWLKKRWNNKKLIEIIKKNGLWKIGW